MNAFLNTVMEKPDDINRLLVWGDWLQEQGDPRGELLALTPAILEKVQSFQRLQLKRAEEKNKELIYQKGDNHKHLFLALQATYTHLRCGNTPDGIPIGIDSKRSIMAGLLRAFNLISVDELKKYNRNAEFDSNSAWMDFNFRFNQDEPDLPFTKHESEGTSYQYYLKAMAASAAELASSNFMRAEGRHFWHTSAIRVKCKQDPKPGVYQALIDWNADTIMSTQSWRVALAEWIVSDDTLPARVTDLINQSRNFD